MKTIPLIFWLVMNVAMQLPTPTAASDPCASRRIAGIYLGIGEGAPTFILRVLALQRATPTRVASTMTVNPMAAAPLIAQLVAEPLMLNLIIGLVAIFIGIWIATTKTR